MNVYSIYNPIPVVFQSMLLCFVKRQNNKRQAGLNSQRKSLLYNVRFSILDLALVLKVYFWEITALVEMLRFDLSALICVIWG